MEKNKWLMFKNYMHNDLGITKEDIREWVIDAVKQQAEKMLKNEFESFDVKDVVRTIIMDKKYFGSESLKSEITYELSKQLLERIKFE